MSGVKTDLYNLFPGMGCTCSDRELQWGVQMMVCIFEVEVLSFQPEQELCSSFGNFFSMSVSHCCPQTRTIPLILLLPLLIGNVLSAGKLADIC